MYKLVIFDLDGTLLNTLGDLAGAGNYALSQLGYPVHPTDAYRYFVGYTVYCPKAIQMNSTKSAMIFSTNTTLRIRQILPCLMMG